MISITKKQPQRPTSPPPRPVPASIPEFDTTDRTEIEIEVFESEPSHKYEPKSRSQSTSTQTTTHRKSVSFDLSDNEYIPVLSHDEPQANDNIGELFLSQFSRENSQEDNDGYEVPIKYPRGPKRKPTKQVKSILRSPSPSSKAPSTPSSLDRPLITSYIQQPQTSVTTAVVHNILHSSDDEIERENPFRKEILGRCAENIYEELNFEEQAAKQKVTRIETNTDYLNEPKKEAKKPADTRIDLNSAKQRPKSAYASSEYTEILSKIHQSNDDLSEKPENTLAAQSTARSTGSLLANRPKQKPPLPPKPPKSTSSAKPVPPVKPSSPVKQADLTQNEALKIFQEGMLHADLNANIAETNEIPRKQHTSSIPIAFSKPVESVVEEKTKESPPRLTTFNPSSPLPPIPKTPTTPPYSKVYKRTTSIERPTVSPPPPPVNLSTLPGVDKIIPIQTEDGSKIEILSTSTEELRKFHRADQHNENAPEYSLVTEETHREILLHENEIRNAMQQEKIVTKTITSTTSRIPVRKAPSPPPPPPPLPAKNLYKNITSISSDVNPEHSSVTTTQSTSSQVFPVTQILPVQYSHLPTPQHPDYFLTFPSSPPQSTCNVMQMPQPGAFSTFMVSDNNGAQTTNIPTNVMCHHSQQLPMYLQRQYISVPISTIHTINQVEHNLQGQNFINIHAKGVQTPVATTMPNNNSAHIFNVYQSNYNQQHQQTQQQHSHYQNQSQSYSPCQQDIHTSHSQSVRLDNNPKCNKHTHNGDDDDDNDDIVDNTNRRFGSSAFSSMNFTDSQFTSNRNHENDTPVTSGVVQSSTKSLTSFSNSTSNYNISEEYHEEEHTFTTFGKQTQV